MEAWQATPEEAMNLQKHTMIVLAQIASWISDGSIDTVKNCILEFLECSMSSRSKSSRVGFLGPLGLLGLKSSRVEFGN